MLHFAALALVAESVEFPERYHRGNFVGTLNLLDAMREHGIKRLVFSSTCATYGEPEQVPMPETLPTNPVNAYGNSKLAVDRMIGDECRAHGLGATSLRYFNVAGRGRPPRGGPLPRDAPDPARAAGRRRHARARVRVRDRLPDARRHRGARLHPRRGPRPRAPARARPRRARPPRDLQPRQRPRLLRARGDRRGAPGDRPRDPGQGGAAAPGRPRAARGLQRADPRASWAGSRRRTSRR